jgi:type VI secretion system protein ImpH
MAGKSGSKAHSVKIGFLKDPVGLNFYQVARRVECLFPKKPRVGFARRAADDPIQFCQQPSLGFAPTTLQRFEQSKQSGKPRLLVNFLGLLGPQGPMPLHITEYVHDREHNHDDPTLARFFDIFNHRMISLFYRAWACNRQTVSHDRYREDRFASYVGSLIGIGHEALRNRDRVPDVAKLHFSGHLGRQARNAEGLRTILENYFGVKTTIEEFVGQWITLPDEYCCKLGLTPDTATIGLNAVVGSQVYDCQQKFRILLGPMNLRQYERMLPGGESFEGLRDWVKNYVGDELRYEVQLILKAEDVPEIKLGESGRLGWTTWLRGRPFENHAMDLKFDSDTL